MFETSAQRDAFRQAVCGRISQNPAFDVDMDTNASSFGRPSSAISAFGTRMTPGGGASAVASLPTTSSHIFGMVNNGTLSPPYQVTSLLEPPNTITFYHAITAMSPYGAFSYEELRMQDYSVGRKVASSYRFGQSAGFGLEDAGMDDSGRTLHPGILENSMGTRNPFAGAVPTSSQQLLQQASTYASGLAAFRARNSGNTPTAPLTASTVAQPTRPASAYDLFGHNSPPPRSGSTGIFRRPQSQQANPHAGNTPGGSTLPGQNSQQNLRQQGATRSAPGTTLPSRSTPPVSGLTTGSAIRPSAFQTALRALIASLPEGEEAARTPLLRQPLQQQGSSSGDTANSTRTLVTGVAGPAEYLSGHQLKVVRELLARGVSGRAIQAVIHGMLREVRSEGGIAERANTAMSAPPPPYRE